ncbi:hypothetical protein V2J09_019992 [Rumex salicifolius]
MGANISTNSVPESRFPACQPTTRFFPLPPPPMTTNTTSVAANGYRVIAFHSSARWRAYFESTKSSNKLIVIDFTASWCGPCKLIEPFFNELATKYTDVDFVKIDVDELMDVGRQFGVQTMPTFLFIKRGQEIDRTVGVKKEELQKKIDKLRLDDNTTNYGYNYYY